MSVEYSSLKSISVILIVLTLFSSVLSCSNRKREEIFSVQIESVNEEDKSRILYIDSYHAELPWVEGITRGILGGLDLSLDENGNPDSKNSNYELKILHLDTKRNQNEIYIKSVVSEARDLIKSWEPDVVIASDDSVSKYLIVPFYKDSELPFVFCGINWDASVYGFPFSNVTGMVEVALIPELIDILSQFGKGERIGLLKGDSLSTRREGEEFEKILNAEIDKVYVETLSEWKEAFIDLQSRVDILLLGNLAALKDWDNDQESIQKFIMEESLIPNGSWDSSLYETALITFANQPEEQGEWAASTALQILAGKSPTEIPIVKNKRVKVYLNMSLAKKMNIYFTQDLLNRSHLVNIAKNNKKVLFVSSYHEGLSGVIKLKRVL